MIMLVTGHLSEEHAHLLLRHSPPPTLPSLLPFLLPPDKTSLPPPLPDFSKTSRVRWCWRESWLCLFKEILKYQKLKTVTIIILKNHHHPNLETLAPALSPSKSKFPPEFPDKIFSLIMRHLSLGGNISMSINVTRR